MMILQCAHDRVRVHQQLVRVDVIYEDIRDLLNPLAESRGHIGLASPRVLRDAQHQEPHRLHYGSFRFVVLGKKLLD